MPGQRPKWHLTATDNNGKDHEIGALWSTASEQVFRGTMDLQDTGDKIKIKLFADRPKPKTQAPEQKPAA